MYTTCVLMLLTFQSKGRQLSSQRSMPRIPVAEPTIQLTPETKRRIMEEIEISVCVE